MPRGYPTLIVRFGCCSARDGGAIGAQDGHLIARIDAFAPRRGFAGAGGVFPAGAGAPFLREEGGDPGAVDEVTCAAEDGGEEEVEEEAVGGVSQPDEEEGDEGGGFVYLHLRIKNTGIRLDDRDRLIERLDRNRGALILRRRQNDREIQLEFLRLQLRREFVADALALPGRDLDAVARGG